MPLPLSGSKKKQSKKQVKGFRSPHLSYLPFDLDFSSTLQMKVICSFETIFFLPAAWCYNPQGHTPQNHCCASLEYKDYERDS
jgi:hypothetical protein